MPKIQLLIVSLLFIWAISSQQTYKRVRLYGNESIQRFYAEIYMGTPSQKQLLVIDTGSFLLTVKCGSCSNCGPSWLTNFDPQLSSSNKLVNCATNLVKCVNKCQSEDSPQGCQFSSYYSNYSSMAKGTISNDIIRFQSDKQENSIPMQSVIGCADILTSRNTQKYNGIFGLAPKTFITPLFNWFQTHPTDRIINICLGDNGGYFQLGTNPKKKKQNIEAVSNFIPNHSALSLSDISSMKFGEIEIFDKQLVINGIAMDTGSPWTIVPYSKYTEISNTLKKICKENILNCNQSEDWHQLCFIISKTNPSQQINQFINSIFPDFVIQFGAGTIKMKASEYMGQNLGQLGGRFCLKIRQQATQQYPYMLGMNWFKNKEVTINLDKNIVEIMPNADCTFQELLQIKQKNVTLQIAISYVILLGTLCIVLKIHKIFIFFTKFLKICRKKNVQFVQERGQHS